MYDLFFVIGTLIMVVNFAVDDRIVQDVSARENRRYSLLSVFSWYWQRRMFSFAWFEEAKRSGLLSAKIAILLVWIAYMAFVFVCVRYWR